MTLSERIAIQKAAGHSSRVTLPIAELQEIIRKAEAYDRLPPLIKDAARELEAVE